MAGRANRTSLLLVISMLFSAVLLASTAGATQVGVTGSVQTIRPDQSIPTNTSISLSGARNEFVSFQVPVRANTGILNNVTVELQSTFQTTGGAQTIPNDNVRFYREDYYTVQSVTDGEIYNQTTCPSSCRWPDILIPEKDVIYNEDRNAFPATVPANENRVAWIDVLIPQGQAPGDYQGVVRVRDGGTTLADLFVNLRVVDFTLPSTSSLDGAFAVTPGKICTPFAGCPETGGTWAMYGNLARLGLENRIGLSNPGYGPPEAWSASQFNQYVLPYINGSSAARLPGARIPSIVLNQHQAPYMGNWKSNAVANNYLDRVTFYCDEMARNTVRWNSECQSPYVTANSNWNGVAPGGQMPTAITLNVFDYNWALGVPYSVATESINTLIPIVNQLHTKAGWGYTDMPASGNQRDYYDGFLSQPGRRLWAYTACFVDYCDAPVDPFTLNVRHNGWPTYSIDQADGEARAMAWQVFNYKASGEYYYEVLMNFNTAFNPDGLFNEGGQGDGTLVYPGTTARIGGTKAIPLESKRLKQIRDGREDYEFLYYLKNHGQEAQARNIAGGPYGSGAGGLFTNMYDSAKNQVAYDSARSQLENLVDGTQPPVEFICGGAPATIIGTPANLKVTGTAGNDVIYIDGSGEFEIDAGPGDDKICGGPAYDTIRPGPGNDWVSGGGPSNALDYSFAAQGMDVDLSSGVASGRSNSETDVFSGFDEAFGGPFDDVLKGTGGVDFLAGNGGRDVIEGRGGNDLIWGDPRDGDPALNGSDADTIDPGAGADRVIAGAGDDRIALRDGEQDTADCGAGSDVADADSVDVLTACEGASGSTPGPDPVDPGTKPGDGGGGGVGNQACQKAKRALKQAQANRRKARNRLRQARGPKARGAAKKRVRRATRQVAAKRRLSTKACGKS